MSLKGTIKYWSDRHGIKVFNPIGFDPLQQFFTEQEFAEGLELSGYYHTTAFNTGKPKYKNSIEPKVVEDKNIAIDVYSEETNEFICTVNVTEDAYDKLAKKGLQTLLEEYCDENTPAIKKVYFNDPYTIVIFNDDEKVLTIASDCDEYNEEIGLAMCIVKKIFGSYTNYKKFIRQHSRV